MSTREEIESYGREEARRERYERLSDSHICPRCDADCACEAGPDECSHPCDESWYEPEERLEAAQGQLHPIFEKILRPLLGTRKQEEVRVPIALRDPRLLLEALSRAGCQEISQFGESLHFVCGTCDCVIQHEELRVRNGSYEDGERIVWKLAAAYADAWCGRSR